MPPTFLLHRRRLVLFLVLGSLALGVLTAQVRAPDRRGIGWAGALAEGSLAPVSRGFSRMSDALAHSWSLLREIGTLRQQNARLAAEVARLRQENAQLRPAAQENAQLRALLAFKREHAYRSVSARVIGRDPSHWFSTILVDRGAADSVQRNDPVVTSDGLVGHVVETGGSWARVLLILDPRSAVGVAVERTREAGVAQGQGNAVVRVKYLSRDADVQPGDRVISSGLGQIYPRGLPIGTVSRVSRPTGVTSLFQEALVTPAAGLNHLEDVLIILRGGVEVAR